MSESTGEIWQWALGRNVWTDPDLQPYAQELGRTTDSADVMVQSQGFELTMDSSGAVVAVTLFNDETALGFPPSDTSFSAYSGALPANLSWTDTSDTIGAQFGAANQSGGWGTEITFAYSTDDGYALLLSFRAGHEAQLPGAYIHSIKVSEL